MRWFFLQYSYEKGIRPDSGGFRKVWEVAWALHRRGHDVRVFYPRLPGWSPLRDVPCRAYPVINRAFMRPLSAYVSMLGAVVQEGRKDHPDALYFRTGMNILPTLAGVWTSCKTFLEVNADTVGFCETEGSPWWAWVARASESWNVRHADAIVALTPGLKRLLIQRYHPGSDRIHVIPSGTDPDHFVPGDRATAKAKLGFSRGHPVVGFLGLFYRHQGVTTLLEAAPRILAEVPDVHFILIGDGVMRPVCEDMARTSGIRHRVWFPGQVPYQEVPLYLQACDVMVAPFAGNRGEASPFKILDALATGCPVIASDIPCIRRLARGFGGAIQLVAPDDPPSLARAVVGMVGDLGRADRLGAFGRQGIERHYTWEKIAQQLEAAGIHAMTDTSGRIRSSTAGHRTAQVRRWARSLLSWSPYVGAIRASTRPLGISAIVRVKDEETWLAASIQSIATVADEVIVADNGSTDGTPDILRTLQRELSSRLVVINGAGLDIKPLSNLLIEHARFRWILRWDADFVARTEGPLQIQGFRRWLEDRDPRRFYFVYPRMVEVCGDLGHQRPGTPTRADCHCFTSSDQLRYVYDARGYESPAVPWWYQVCRFERPTFFHVDVKPAERMFRSHLWKQFLLDRHRLRNEDFETYVGRRVHREWGSESVSAASRKWLASAFRDLIPYDQDTMGTYPSLLHPDLERPRFQVVYEDGQIVDRVEPGSRSNVHPSS